MSVDASDASLSAGCGPGHHFDQESKGAISEVDAETCVDTVISSSSDETNGCLSADFHEDPGNHLQTLLDLNNCSSINQS